MFVEQAYETIAEYAVACVDGDGWESITIHSNIYDQMSSSKVEVEFGENSVFVKQSHLPSELSEKRNIATLFLRDDLVLTTGKRAWGMKFKLTKNGKIKINYCYEKPSHYSD